MNKQRLLELAGVVITEARQAGQPVLWYGTASMDDGQFLITAPFKSIQEARKYIEWEKQEFDLTDEETAEVITIEPPAW